MTIGAVRRGTALRCLFLASCLLATTAGPAAAQTTLPCERPVLTLDEASSFLRVEAATLEQLATSGDVPGRRVGTTWRFGCDALVAWLNGSGHAGTEPTSPPLTTRDLGIVSGRGQTDPDAPAQSEDPRQDEPIGEAPQERTAEDVFLRDQRVLLGRGDVVLDVGQFYLRRDDLQLISVDGAIGLATLEQRALTTFLVGRVGVFRETEVFASTSFNRLDGRLFIGSATLGSSEDTSFGSTTLGVRRTLLREGTGRPDVILTFNGQFATDTAPAAIGGGVVAVKSLDPVVLFASTGYSRTLETDIDGQHLAPLSLIDVSMGYGLGLNDTVAISTAVSGRFSGKATTFDVTATAPSSYSARLGLTAWLAEGLYIEPSVTFGLSDPGNAFAFGVTLPYAF